MDEFIQLKILSCIDDKKEFKKFIESINMSESTKKQKLANLLLDKYLKDTDSSIDDALFSLLNQEKKYMIEHQLEGYPLSAQMIGTKEEVIQFMTSHTYNTIDYLRLDVEQYNNVTKEEVYNYYTNNFIVSKLILDTDKSYVWDLLLINGYGNILVGDDADEYIIYDMDDINTITKHNKTI